MPHVNSENFSPLIEIITYFCLAASAFAVSARFVTKYFVIHVISLDDYFVVLSLVFSIGQSAAVLVEARNGLGKPSPISNQAKLYSIDKADYAGNFLFISGLGFAKLSVLALTRLLTPNRRDQRIMVVVEVIISIWAVTAIFVNAFMCSPSRPWDYGGGHCIDRLSFWTYFEVANIVTNAGLIVLPLLIISKVQTSLRRKVKAVSAFSFRLMPIAASICKLVYWQRLFHASDPIIEWWPIYVCTQTIQCTEIMATCALYLRPFLQVLQSGFLNLDDLRRRGAMTPFTLGSNNVSRTIAVNNSVRKDGWASHGSIDLRSQGSRE